MWLKRMLILEVELAFRAQNVFIKKQNPLVMKGNIFEFHSELRVPKSFCLSKK